MSVSSLYIYCLSYIFWIDFTCSWWMGEYCNFDYIWQTWSAI